MSGGGGEWEVDAEVQREEREKRDRLWEMGDIRDVG